MRKVFVGPRLRQLRRERQQTQGQMAQALGVSAGYVNLLENNQRSLSAQMLMSLSDAYGVDWRDLVKDDGSERLGELRTVLRDPVFGGRMPDLQELRGALDHAPSLAERFVELHAAYRRLSERALRLGGQEGGVPVPTATPETLIHDFFRANRNHFPTLEDAAEALNAEGWLLADERYSCLKRHLRERLGTEVVPRPVQEMTGALRDYDEAEGRLTLSDAMDHQNKVFQLVHMVALIEHRAAIEALVTESGIEGDRGKARLRVELANYFAAAVLMPYGPFLEAAEAQGYDIDDLAVMFDVSFEQVCHRFTTLQREGARGIPFFFLRVDKAGNVTKRFNATAFQLAEYGGACPRWNIHLAFRNPGTILPQLVELPDGERFLTLSRSVDRPRLGRDMSHHRLVVAIGCPIEAARRIAYTRTLPLDQPEAFTPVGINCHLCPRQACIERAHQPIHMDLPMDERRRGQTRYEN